MLPNGLAVWLVESHRLPVVSASLVSRLGSAADPPDRPGLADLTTSTLDKGTATRDALGLARELEAAGATLGNDTDKDGTWLSATALTGQPRSTLTILADVARHPTFPADEVDLVRDATIVGLRQDRDSAGTIADTVAVREVYGAGHPYAHRSTGTEDGLRAATADDLRRAHARAFTPATTALVLAGDLTPAEARTLAEAAFGSWSTPAGSRGGDRRSPGGRPRIHSAFQPPAPGPPAGTPERVLIVDKPGASQTALVLAAPGVPRADPDFEPLLVTNRIFGGGFSSRLNANLREAKGYTYGAYSSVDASRGVGLLTISMDVQGDSTAAAVGETLREVDTPDGVGRERRGAGPGPAVDDRIGGVAVRHPVGHAGHAPHALPRRPAGRLLPDPPGPTGRPDPRRCRRRGPAPVPRRRLHRRGRRRPGRHRGAPAGAGPRPGQPPDSVACCSARRAISSGSMSSTWVATLQR